MKLKGLKRWASWLLALALCVPLPAAVAEAPEPPVTEVGEISLWQEGSEPVLTAVDEIEGIPWVAEQADLSLSESGTGSPESGAAVAEPDAGEKSGEGEAAGSDGETPRPELRLSAERLTLGLKETRYLAAELDGEAPEEAVYRSSSSKIVSVNGEGKLTAKKAGSATITVICGELSAACEVKVVKAPSKVTLSASKLTLGEGQTRLLKASLPKGTASAVTWKSGKPGVAAVDGEGRVTAVSQGTATITATVCSGKSASCKVTVQGAPTGIAFASETLTLSVGQRVTPTARVEGGSGYALSVEGDCVAVEDGKLVALHEGAGVVTAETYNGLTAALNVTVLPAPGEMRLEPERLELGVKAAQSLSPVFDTDAPANVTYASSNPKVAAVDAEGRVTGKAAGKATVTATTYNGLTATCQVQVFKAPNKVSFKKNSLILGTGDTYPLEATLPANTRSTLKWHSSDPKVAAVDQNGLVTALARGNATIIVTTENNKKAACKIKVIGQPTRLELSRTALTFYVDATAELMWALDTGEGEVALTVGDENVAIIKSASDKKAVLLGVAGGETTVKATTPNGLTAEAHVTVLPLPTRLGLPEYETTLGVGERYVLMPDTDAGDISQLRFTSSSKGVAKVTADGEVTGVKSGNATITVKTANNLIAKLKVKVTAAPASLTLSDTALDLIPGQCKGLTATLSKGAGTRVTFVTSDPAVAEVSDAGEVTAIADGEATITASTYNGCAAACVVRVVTPLPPPSAPEAVSIDADETGVRLAWTPVVDANSYNVYIGDHEELTRAKFYGTFAADTTEIPIRGLGAGTLWRVLVTAQNTHGETPLTEAALAIYEAPGSEADSSIALDYSGGILLAVGDEKDLTARVTPEDYSGGLTWEVMGGAVTLEPREDLSCRVTGSVSGDARVLVTLENGKSASVFIQVVDAADLSEANFATVQKALMNDDRLMNEDEGGNVIWSMITRKLEKGKTSETRVRTIVEKLKTAETLFRDLFVYAIGSFDIQANTTKDKSGGKVSVSNFRAVDDTVYVLSRKYDDQSSVFVTLHESGHAVDYYGNDRQGQYSNNPEAAAVVLSDVRQLLQDRVGEAAAVAQVSEDSYDPERVVEAVLNHRTLLDKKGVMAGLNASEQKVFEKLTKLLAEEMNATLPVNNGTMVWDAVEGATNFAVSGKAGHSYLLKMPNYKKSAVYYYYDKSGNPSISTEPWAEFYSANVMQDAATLALNLTYLPKTCQYFTEVVAPKLLEGLKSIVKSK